VQPSSCASPIGETCYVGLVVVLREGQCGRPIIWTRIGLRVAGQRMCPTYAPSVSTLHPCGSQLLISATSLPFSEKRNQIRLQDNCLTTDVRTRFARLHYWGRTPANRPGCWSWRCAPCVVFVCACFGLTRSVGDKNRPTAHSRRAPAAARRGPCA